MAQYLKIFHPLDGAVIPGDFFVAQGYCHSGEKVRAWLIDKEGNNDPREGQPPKPPCKDPRAWLRVFKDVPPGNYVLLVHELNCFGEVVVSEHVAVMGSPSTAGLEFGGGSISITWPTSNDTISASNFAPYGTLNGGDMGPVSGSIMVDNQPTSGSGTVDGTNWSMQFPSLPTGTGAFFMASDSDAHAANTSGLTVQ
jgi:hypothetical protein